MKIGILALQGDYQKHQKILQTLGIDNIYVRYPEDLQDCSGLIIPGGESTTLSKLIQRNNLYDLLVDFGTNNPVFGTCAGLIMMSNQPNDSRIQSLRFLNISVKRNGWGSQKYSFKQNIQLEWDKGPLFKAIFIRAPIIANCKGSVKVLSKLNSEPILIRKNNYLGATFHPELVEDHRIHQYFIKMVNAQI